MKVVIFKDPSEGGICYDYYLNGVAVEEFLEAYEIPNTKEGNPILGWGFEDALFAIRNLPFPSEEVVFEPVYPAVEIDYGLKLKLDAEAAKLISIIARSPFVVEQPEGTRAPSTSDGRQASFRKTLEEEAFTVYRKFQEDPNPTALRGGIEPWNGWGFSVARDDGYRHVARKRRWGYDVAVYERATEWKEELLFSITIKFLTEYGEAELRGFGLKGEKIWYPERKK